MSKGSSQGADAARSRDERDDKLSYKFQRLREMLRQAILTGQFTGRLPGERELARQFGANAKTINKALGDLCAEGLLVRRIGRGTFVSAHGVTAAQGGERHRTFRCILPAPHVSEPEAQKPESGHRGHGEEEHAGAAAVAADSVRRQLADRGHELVELPVESFDRVGGNGSFREEVPLSAWAPGLRHATDGILACPDPPLCAARGQLSSDLILHAYRRHVPIVVLGAFAGHAKLNAAVPDYGDGGFRAAEHLFQAGCHEVHLLAIRQSGREAEALHAGCHTATARHHGELTRVVLRDDAAEQIQALMDGGSRNGGAQSRAPVGLLCAGGCVLDEVLRQPSVQRARNEGRAVLAAVLDLGDTTAERAGVTAYEFDADTLAHWAAKLLLESRPGQRPVEVYVPGILRIRPAVSTGNREAAPRVTAAGGQVVSDAIV